jgi:predicted PhzF superfamily epimerase YddE/YHI9
MAVALFHVDAFTNKPFAGNPAAVCILTEHRDDVWMQNVAREMNLSETAFLQKRSDGFDLRWFTPTVEVNLCGHATLASAHVLWENGILKENQQARFHTRSGILTAERKDKWIELDFPVLPDNRIAIPKRLGKILGARPSYVGRNRMDYLAEVGSEKIVRKMKPDFAQLAELPCRGLIVTAPAASKPYDFVSRFFAPRVGINEDPVTGSAHCCLGPYWQRRLRKNEFLAQQVSPRGGIIRVRVGNRRVNISGEAVTVLRGELSEQS